MTAVIALTKALTDGLDRDVPWGRVIKHPHWPETLLKEGPVIMSGDTRENFPLGILPDDIITITTDRQHAPQGGALMASPAAALNLSRLKDSQDVVVIGGAETYHRFKKQTAGEDQVNNFFDRLITLSLDGVEAPREMHEDFSHLNSQKIGVSAVFSR